VNFTTGFGDHVSFDKNGDALAIYDVMNWQPSSDGAIRVSTVGVVNEGATAGNVLTLNDDEIFWNFENKKVIYIYIYNIHFKTIINILNTHITKKA